MAGDAPIPIQTLSPEQLNQLRQTIDTDIQSFERAFESLRAARNRFFETKRSLEGVQAQEPGTEMMVPLTTSLYVPGKLTDTSRVVVDLGTGFFAKMKTTKAIDYYKRKCEMIGSQMEKVADTANIKVRQREQVTETLRRKLLASQ